MTVWPDPAAVAAVLEAGMLLAFSLGWYLSIWKMLRVRCAVGKSALFVALVTGGYAMGLGAKILHWQMSGELSPVAWLYAWNGLVTAFDLFLVLLFSRRLDAGPARHEPRSEAVAAPARF